MLDVQSQGIPVEPLEAVPGQVDQCQVVHVTEGIRGQLHYLILVQVNLKMINMINIYFKNVLQAITYLPSKTLQSFVVHICPLMNEKRNVRHMYQL